MIFLICPTHGGVHRPIAHGPLVVPEPICGAHPRCQLVVAEELPPIDSPARICPPCHPSFWNGAAGSVMRWLASVEADA